MKTRLFNMLAAALLLAGCSEECSPIASCEETVSDAVVKLCDQGFVTGCGVLVGFVRDGDEHVFLLTARHVATYSNLIDRILELRIGNLTCETVTSRDRWMCARKAYDAAWMELMESEKVALREKGALKYIPLVIPESGPTASMLPNTGTLNYADLFARSPGVKPEIHMFYKASVAVTNMPVGKLTGARIPHGHNKNLKFGDYDVIAVATDDLSIPGDSGGPAFVQEVVDGKKRWSLVGLVLGGNTITRVNAVLPMDEISFMIRHGTIKLADHPEFW